jgi:hypothetical protein
MLEYLFQNFTGLDIIIIILLFLIIISFVPLIELKYQSDLYENIDKFNKYCLNDDVNLIKELNVKSSYMWNMSMYLYDYDNISKFFYRKGENYERDYKELNRDLSSTIYDFKIIDNIMKIYNYYLGRSLWLFIFLIIFFISQMYIFIIMDTYDEQDTFFYCFYKTLQNNDAKKEFFRYYVYILCIYILLFIIFFSIILKKLTELYADTDTYEYIMLMKEFDIILKENNEKNADIINILKKHSKYKNNDVSYITINDSKIVNELIEAIEAYEIKSRKKGYANFSIENKENYSIRLKNLEKIEYYNSDESKSKVKNKVEDIFRFIYVYILFLIVPLYILSISLQGKYTYMLFIIIILIIFSISVYSIYNTLQA